MGQLRVASPSSWSIAKGARVLIYRLGALADTAGTLGAEVKRHRQGGLAAQKLQRYEDQEARHNLRDAAEWAADYLAQQGDAGRALGHRAEPGRSSRR